MSKLTPNAELLVDALYEHYNSNVESSKYFDDFSKLPFSGDELSRCCSELEKYGLVLIEEYSDGAPYLYIMFELLTYKDTGTLHEVTE